MSWQSKCPHCLPLYKHLNLTTSDVANTVHVQKMNGSERNNKHSDQDVIVMWLTYQHKTLFPSHAFSLKLTFLSTECPQVTLTPLQLCYIVTIQDNHHLCLVTTSAVTESWTWLHEKMSQLFATCTNWLLMVYLRSVRDVAMGVTLVMQLVLHAWSQHAKSIMHFCEL